MTRSKRTSKSAKKSRAVRLTWKTNPKAQEETAQAEQRARDAKAAADEAEASRDEVKNESSPRRKRNSPDAKRSSIRRSRTSGRESDLENLEEGKVLAKRAIKNVVESFKDEMTASEKLLESTVVREILGAVNPRQRAPPLSKPATST